MRNLAFVRELRDMITGPTVFLGKPSEFMEELNAIHVEEHGEKLFSLN